MRSDTGYLDDSARVFDPRTRTMITRSVIYYTASHTGAELFGVDSLTASGMVKRAYHPVLLPPRKVQVVYGKNGKKHTFLDKIVQADLLQTK